MSYVEKKMIKVIRYIKIDVFVGIRVSFNIFIFKYVKVEIVIIVMEYMNFDVYFD